LRKQSVTPPPRALSPSPFQNRARTQTPRIALHPTLAADYLTFLGYSELPFLRRCEAFVYPIAPVLLGWFLSIIGGLNCTSLVAYIYFG